jgi:hypothetical protein
MAGFSGVPKQNIVQKIGSSITGAVDTAKKFVQGTSQYNAPTGGRGPSSPVPVQSGTVTDVINPNNQTYVNTGSSGSNSNSSTSIVGSSVGGSSDSSNNQNKKEIKVNTGPIIGTGSRSGGTTRISNSNAQVTQINDITGVRTTTQGGTITISDKNISANTQKLIDKNPGGFVTFGSSVAPTGYNPNKGYEGSSTIQYNDKTGKYDVTTKYDKLGGLSKTDIAPITYSITEKELKSSDPTTYNKITVGNSQLPMEGSENKKSSMYTELGAYTELGYSRMSTPLSEAGFNNIPGMNEKGNKALQNVLSPNMSLRGVINMQTQQKIAEYLSFNRTTTKIKDNLAKGYTTTINNNKLGIQPHTITDPNAMNYDPDRWKSNIFKDMLVTGGKNIVTGTKAINRFGQDITLFGQYGAIELKANALRNRDIIKTAKAQGIKAIYNTNTNSIEAVDPKKQDKLNLIIKQTQTLSGISNTENLSGFERLAMNKLYPKGYTKENAEYVMSVEGRNRALKGSKNTGTVLAVAATLYGAGAPGTVAKYGGSNVVLKILSKTGAVLEKPMFKYPLLTYSAIKDPKNTLSTAGFGALLNVGSKSVLTAARAINTNYIINKLPLYSNIIKPVAKVSGNIVGYGLGGTMIGLTALDYGNKIREEGLGLATLNLASDFAAFNVGYHGSEIGINKISDIKNTMGLKRGRGSDYFSPDTVTPKGTKSMSRESFVKPVVDNILSGAKAQSNIKSPVALTKTDLTKAIDSVETLNLNEKKALYKTSKNNPNIAIFGSLGAKITSKGETKIPHDLDMAAGDIPSFFKTFVKNIDSKSDKYSLKQAKFGYKLLRNNKPVGDIKQLEVLREKNLEIKNTRGRTITNLKTEPLENIDGIPVVSFAEQTSRKAQGASKALYESNARRNKDVPQFISQLEIQKTNLENTKPKNFFDRLILNNKKAKLDKSLNYLKKINPDTYLNYKQSITSNKFKYEPQGEILKQLSLAKSIKQIETDVSKLVLPKTQVKAHSKVVLKNYNKNNADDIILTSQDLALVQKQISGYQRSRGNPIVQHSSSQPLPNTRKIGGVIKDVSDKPGYEGKGLFTSPYGKGSTLFTRVQTTQTELEKSLGLLKNEPIYSLSIFGEPISRPTITTFSGITGTIRAPKKVLEKPGFEPTDAYFKQFVGKGKVVIGKRAEIGQGTIKAQNYIAKEGYAMNGKKTPAGTILKEKGSSENELQILTGEKYVNKKQKEYILLQGDTYQPGIKIETVEAIKNIFTTKPTISNLKSHFKNVKNAGFPIEKDGKMYRRVVIDPKRLITNLKQKNIPVTKENYNKALKKEIDTKAAEYNYNYNKRTVPIGSIFNSKYAYKGSNSQKPYINPYKKPGSDSRISDNYVSKPYTSSYESSKTYSSSYKSPSSYVSFSESSGRSPISSVGYSGSSKSEFKSPIPTPYSFKYKNKKTEDYLKNNQKMIGTINFSNYLADLSKKNINFNTKTKPSFTKRYNTPQYNFNYRQPIRQPTINRAPQQTITRNIIPKQVQVQLQQQRSRAFAQKSIERGFGKVVTGAGFQKKFGTKSNWM